MIAIDFGLTNGLLRPLHGVNRGPLVAGGIVDLTERHRELGIPFNRLHDSHWPNSDVVDIHSVFPDSAADPANAGNYQFAFTDEYLLGVRQTGAEIIYRLGESIEHTRIKRYVHPPKDPERWAAVCLGIIRHYNEGWADGMRLGIRYWEIWNEPENRPVMWTGTDDQLLRLYKTTARAIRQHDPKLKVGGPGFGYTGSFVDGRFETSSFVSNFLATCRQEEVPLDFFSWHCYTDDPGELVARAKAIRSLLDANGFQKTESHLNEWNYLPQKSWTPLLRSAAPEVRQAAYGTMSGHAGAAFIAASLIRLQDAPVDVCNLFHAETGAFGLFTEQGVPLPNFHAVRAFRDLLHTPSRVHASAPGNYSVAAGVATSRRHAQVLIASFGGNSTLQVTLKNLPWDGTTTAEVRMVTTNQMFRPVPHRLEHQAIQLNFEGAGVALISLRQAEEANRGK